MNEKIAIRVEGLGKRYRLGQRLDLTRTFRETLITLPRFFGRKAKHAAGSVRRKIARDDGAGSTQPAPSTPSGTFWALRDVDFTVCSGEVLGIIGRNGAGKSTLLKVLSRITSPTEGRAEIHGRMGSLLEVGTGFHPELTGRENIFLNGAILGMRKTEIERKFDEIVAFAEVDRFLDTPVKRYSSGMYVRLAFAVAAHLEPEILVVDEVLAVGDAAFQRKCLGKMGDVAQSGRTVLFVSHNLGAVADLCNRCLLLLEGRLVAQGPTQDVISRYLEHARKQQGWVDLENLVIGRSGSGPMRLTSIRLTDESGCIRSTFHYGETIEFRLGVKSPKQTNCIVGIAIRNASGQLVLHLNNTDDHSAVHVSPHSSEISVILPQNILNDGIYYVTLWLGDDLNVLHDRAGDCISFHVDDAIHGNIRSCGQVRLPCRWKVLSRCQGT